MIIKGDEKGFNTDVVGFQHKCAFQFCLWLDQIRGLERVLVPPHLQLSILDILCTLRAFNSDTRQT